MGEGGYRGYIGSRPVAGTSYPQKVQNLVIRDYAARHGLDFKLSVTEYAMPDCHMMLQDVLAELDQLDGIILFSLFMLPRNPGRRQEIYRRVLGQGAVLHTALEERHVAGAGDIPQFEDILLVDAWLPHALGHGYWHKAG